MIGPQEIIDRLFFGILRNLIAWALLVALLFSEYSRYSLGLEIDNVCELTGPHDVMTGNPRNDRDRVDNICGPRQGQ